MVQQVVVLSDGLQSGYLQLYSLFIVVSMLMRKLSKGAIIQTDHYLFHLLGFAPKSRTKVCAQWWMSLSCPPRKLASARS